MYKFGIENLKEIKDIWNIVFLNETITLKINHKSVMAHVYGIK